jgi:hypothetical protein
MAGLVRAIHAAPFPDNPKLFRRLDDVAECTAFGRMTGTSPVMTALVS